MANLANRRSSSNSKGEVLSLEKKDNGKFSLYIGLTDLEKEIIVNNFEEMEISFEPKQHHPHGLAAAFRKCETEILLRRIMTGNQQIVDIGGNFAEHISRNRPFIHSCCPILDIRDGTRFTRRLLCLNGKAYSWREKPCGKKSAMAIFKEVGHKMPNPLYCNYKAQDCKVQAASGMAIHSIYDIDFDDLAEIMDSHGMYRLVGSFLYFPEILSEKEEVCHVSLKVLVKKNYQEDTIEFVFKNDSSTGYIHKFSNYLKYLTGSFLKSKSGKNYMYELKENRNGVQFFEILYSVVPPMTNSVNLKYLWYGDEKLLAVRVYGYGMKEVKLKRSNMIDELETGVVYFPKLFYDRALEYALGLSEREKQLNDIFSYMRSLNNRLIVSGVNVTQPVREEAEVVFRVALSVYCHAFMLKHERNQVIPRAEKNVDQYFENKKKGVLELAFCLMLRVGRLGMEKIREAKGLRKWMQSCLGCPDKLPTSYSAPIYMRVEEHLHENLNHFKKQLFITNQKPTLMLKTHPNHCFSDSSSSTSESSIDSDKSMVNKMKGTVKTLSNKVLKKLRPEPAISSTDSEEDRIDMKNKKFLNSLEIEKKTEQDQTEFNHQKLTELQEELSEKLSKQFSSDSAIDVSENSFEASDNVETQSLQTQECDIELEVDNQLKPRKFHGENQIKSQNLNASNDISVVAEIHRADPPMVNSATEPMVTLARCESFISSSSVAVSLAETNVTEEIQEAFDGNSIVSYGSMVEDYNDNDLKIPLMHEQASIRDEDELESAKKAIDEFINYTKQSWLSTYSVGKQLWDEMISPYTKTPNIYNLKPKNNSQEASILIKTCNNQYKPFQIEGIVLNPPIGEFEAAFDGEKFVDLKLESLEKSLYSTSQPNPNMYLLVWKDTRLLQAEKIYKRIKHITHVNSACTFTLVEGVPGCGKTTEIINAASNEDLIVTVARKTCDEIKEKWQQVKGKNNQPTIRTVDSFLLNEVKTYSKVWFDEGLMVHAGVIELVAAMAKAREVYVYGDRNQLNFISRVGDFDTKFHRFQWFSKLEFRPRSYRCPHDVAKLFRPLYQGGFNTKNKVRTSMQVKRVQNIQQISKRIKKYLTFTQEEKKDLIKNGFENVNTIHEAQGTTYEEVALIRLNPKSVPIFNSVQHILVGLTRHTKKFFYATVVTDDEITKMIEDENYGFKTIMNSFDETEITMEQKGKPTMELMETTKEEEKVFTESEIAKVIIENSLLRNNALNLRGDYSYTTEFSSTNVLETRYKPLVKPINTSASPIIALQDYYDSVFPEASTEYNEFDEYQVQHSDITFHVDNAKLNIAKDGERAYRLTDKKPSYQPKLRTAQPNDRTGNFRQALLALCKRNFDTPRFNLPYEFDRLYKETEESLMRLFLTHDAKQKLEIYSNEPVVLSEKNLTEWACAQEPSKLKKINLQSLELELEKMVDYTMMIKKEPKNRLEDNAIFNYDSPQSIIYHSPEVNIVFGAIFKELFKRFISILSPHVCVMLRKSREQIEEHMNKYLNKQFKYAMLEVDFSKFDKSQLDLCFDMEMKMWELLGMDSYLLGLWKLGHKQTKVTDFISGIKAYISYQRKSGDSATAFGNTLITMLSIAYTSRFDRAEAAYFVGDDSLIFLRKSFDHTGMVEKLRNTYNLTAKVILKDVGYFCSMFVIQTEKGFRLVPDPLKRIEKLGKRHEVETESEMRERYESFKELMTPLFESQEILEITAIALNERYKNSDLTLKALENLKVIAGDFKQFLGLYQRPRTQSFKYLPRFKTKSKNKDKSSSL